MIGNGPGAASDWVGLYPHDPRAFDPARWRRGLRTATTL